MVQTDAGSHRGLALSIFAGAFVFGVVMASLGALLPALSAAIGFEKADAGGLFLASNFGMLISSLAFGPICDRFGYRALLLASTVLIGGAFWWMSALAAYGPLVAALAILGLGGGALNGGANALLNDISPDRRQSALNLLGIYFGFGALFMPLFTGSLLAWAGLRSILMGLAGLTVVPLVLFAAARFPASKHSEGISWDSLERVLRNPLLYLLGFLLFFQSGNEFTVGGWLSTYLGEQLGATPSTAAYVLAAYWAAMMLGRLTASRMAGRLSPPALVCVSALVAACSAAALINVSRMPFATACSVGIGLGFAAIFPTTLAQVGAAFPGFSATAFSVVFAMALAGGMTAPWAVGRIAQVHGVGSGLRVTVVSCLAVAGLQCVIRARMRGSADVGTLPSGR